MGFFSKKKKPAPARTKSTDIGSLFQQNRRAISRAEIRAADIDETMDPSQTPAHEVAAVSARKAEKIAALHPQDVIVSADTIVVIDGKILGKPKDEQDAARMLRLLSGRTHTVYTGLTVHANGKANTQVVSTGVTFRDLSNAEIAAYIETKEPMDKAGAYGIQGYGSMFVSHLDGDYFCVMGLPVCTLAWMLRDAGVRILGQA